MISERRFQKLCDEIIADRIYIQQLNPSLSVRDAILWMLLGQLVALFSISDAELEQVFSPAANDPYKAAIVKVLRTRTRPPFDPRIYLQKVLADLADDT